MARTGQVALSCWIRGNDMARRFDHVDCRSTQDLGHTSQIGWPREHLLALVAAWGSTCGGGSSELGRDVGGGGRRSATNIGGGGGGHREVSSGDLGVG